ncbi:hypothetical protein ES708_15258 [subsurface metagenome]
MSALVCCSAAGGVESRFLAYVKERKKKPDTILLMSGIRKKMNLPESILRGFFGEVKNKGRNIEKKLSRMGCAALDGSVWYHST